MEDEGPETFSKDSPRLQFQSPSSRIPWDCAQCASTPNWCGIVSIGGARRNGRRAQRRRPCALSRVPLVVMRSMSVREASRVLVLVVGEVAGAETERGVLNDSLRGGKGGALAKFGWGPRIRLEVRFRLPYEWLEVETAEDGRDRRGRALAGTERLIIVDPIFEIYWRGSMSE